MQYDGGTQLGAIGPVPGTEKPDLYLLFTDGISTFGREEPAKLDAPLVVFSAAAGANHAFLDSLAMTNGGRYFNLANWKDADILAQIGRPAWSFLAATVEKGGAEGIYPQRPQPRRRPLYAGGQAHGRDGHGPSEIWRPGRGEHVAEQVDSACRCGRRFAPPPALGAEEAGRADDLPEAQRAGDHGRWENSSGW